MSTLKPGMEAPDFEAVTHDGSKFRLSSLRGKIVVLYFYPRAMTKGCTREGIRFNELLEEFEKHGAVVVGVSTDPPEKNRRFAEKHGFRFQLISDPEGRIASLYGVLKTSKCGGKTTVSAKRVTYIIDDKGRVAVKLENVRPAEKHADLALEAVRRLAGSL